MLKVPTIVGPLVDKAGVIRQAWNNFLQQFAQPPHPISDLPIGASPFQYTAKEPGSIIIEGGTITGRTLTRGTSNAVNIAITQNIIPVEEMDFVTIAFSVIPTHIYFVPRY